MSAQLSGEREAALARAALGGDRRAREQLIVAQLPRVRAIAHAFGGLGLTTAELEQEGAAGVTAAVPRFDPGRGVPFDRYATWAIRRSIMRALTEQARTVRLPAHLVDNQRRVRRAQAELGAATGRTATVPELATATTLTRRQVVRALNAIEIRTSLNSAVATGIELIELVADGDAIDPAEAAELHELAERVHDGLRALPEREREILARHFGLQQDEETLDDVAADLGLSRERARQVEQHALAQLAGRLAELHD